MKLSKRNLVRLTMLAGAITLAAVAAVGMGGCNLIAAGAFIVGGYEKTEAVYTLDEKRTTVIFVDDRGSVLRQRAVRELIASGAEEKLLEEKIVLDMVQGRQAIAASKTERAGKLLTIEQIGKVVLAQVIIYANVDSFTLKPDGQTYQPTAVLSVKVIDVETGLKLFPNPDSGQDSYSFTVNFKERTEEAPGSFAAELGEEQRFAKSVGVRLAQLFFKHDRIENAGDSLRERRK